MMIKRMVKTKRMVSFLTVILFAQINISTNVKNWVCKINNKPRTKKNESYRFKQNTNNNNFNNVGLYPNFSLSSYLIQLYFDIFLTFAFLFCNNSIQRRQLRKRPKTIFFRDVLHHERRNDVRYQWKSQG